jgi:hypothetical protein
MLTERLQNLEQSRSGIGMTPEQMGRLFQAFSQADASTGLRLDEVELSVEISAEGQLSIVGNGGKLGNTGGIKWTLFYTPIDDGAYVVAA